MHKSATKCNETVGKWCKNKHGASKIIDTLETYHGSSDMIIAECVGVNMDFQIPLLIIDGDHVRIFSNP
jgi:hypothetical protein